MRIAIAAGIAAMLATSPVAAQTVEAVNEVLGSIFGDPEKFETAYTTLRMAVEEGDAETVAALAAYPLVVRIGEQREIGSPEAFVASYDTIMTEEIVTAIAEQDYADLFVNDQGMMFGNGQVWMTGVCEDDDCAVWDVRIVTIQSTAE